MLWWTCWRVMTGPSPVTTRPPGWLPSWACSSPPLLKGSRFPCDYYNPELSSFQAGSTIKTCNSESHIFPTVRRCLSEWSAPQVVLCGRRSAGWGSGRQRAVDPAGGCGAHAGRLLWHPHRPVRTSVCAVRPPAKERPAGSSRVNHRACKPIVAESEVVLHMVH